jgi:hypothetical protein
MEYQTLLRRLRDELVSSADYQAMFTSLSECTMLLTSQHRYRSLIDCLLSPKNARRWLCECEQPTALAFGEVLLNLVSVSGSFVERITDTLIWCFVPDGLSARLDDCFFFVGFFWVWPSFLGLVLAHCVSSQFAQKHSFGLNWVVNTQILLMQMMSTLMLSTPSLARSAKFFTAPSACSLKPSSIFFC